MIYQNKAYSLVNLEQKANELISNLKQNEVYRQHIQRQIDLKFVITELGEDSQDLFIEKSISDRVNSQIESIKTAGIEEIEGIWKEKNKKKKDKIKKYKDKIREYEGTVENLKSEIESMKEEDSERSALIDNLTSQIEQNKIDQKDQKASMDKADKTIKSLKEKHADEVKEKKKYIEEVKELKEIIEKIEEEKKNEIKEEVKEELKDKVISKKELNKLLGTAGLNALPTNNILTLNCEEAKHVDLMKKMLNSRLVDLDYLKILLSKLKDNDIRDFLKNGLPNSINKLTLSFEDGKTDDSTKEVKIYPVDADLSNVNETLCISHGVINKDGFQNILGRAVYITTLVFNECTFSNDKYELNLEHNPLIKTLSFQSGGKATIGDWAQTPMKLDVLIKAIHGSALKDSLEVISIYDCGITEVDAKKIADKNGLTKVNFNTAKIDL